MVTPHATEETVRAAVHADAWEVIAQPATERRLVQAVQRAVTPPPRRTSERVAAILPALLARPARPAAPSPCIIENLSLSGARCSGCTTRTRQRSWRRGWSAS